MTRNAWRRSLFVLLLIFSHPVIAQQPAGTQKPQAAGDNKPATREASDAKRQQPPANFEPSEKLRADDAVAFPVDI
jgi:hypothetical protein